MRKLFTSESVTEGHPDKLCDQIADAILDAILRKQSDSRVEKLLELKTLIQSLEIPTYFATMGASNCINVQGHLPKDKAKMIKWLDEVIGSVDEKELRRYRVNLRHL